MFKPKREYDAWQTPEQRKVQEQIWRECDEYRVAVNNALQFWRMCREDACRRNHACSGDMHECFQRHWAMNSQDEKAWLRAALKAMAAGLSPGEILHAADAAQAQHLELTATLDSAKVAAAPSPQSAATPAPVAAPPMPRIRQL